MGYVDWVLLLALAFVLLGSLGIVYGTLGSIHHIRRRGADSAPRAKVAIAAFVLQYVLVFTLPAVGNYLLLPTILMFLIVLALLIAIRLGWQDHSKSGMRIALAALFTLGAYTCKLGSDYYQATKLHR